MKRLERAENLGPLAVWLAQLFIFAASGVIAFLLRFDLRIPRVEYDHLAYAIPIWLVAKSLSFWFLRLHRGWWRFVSLPDILRIGLGNVLGSATATVGILLLAEPGFPRSIYLLDFLICFLATCTIRVILRMVAETAVQLHQSVPGHRTLIYGAGTAGQMLLREIRSNARLPYRVCGFIDDDPQKKGISIQGVRVWGSGSDVAEIVAEKDVKEILVALPSATGSQMSQILQYCHSAGVPCKTIPGIGEIIESSSLAVQIRDVAVDDLLGRTPVDLDTDQIYSKLHDQVVVVTGAAGSIGSEICRQVARFRPRAIIGYEISETALFLLDREMRASFPEVPFYAEIGSIQNSLRLSEVFDRHHPSMLYHAAAYKHVPMMEEHIFEALENNVFGTYNVAQAALEHDVENFVLISSDKAVHPTNIMGATKRVSEMVVLGFQNSRTRFVSVRFGNVLGSNGSVIPLFKQQIAAGGPVTVTHPEMCRYFMTIPEASQLVLQASTMGKGGEIFVLDMGSPVRIVDLARNLILLSGLRPDEDIKIEFIGMRPGEKLYEELSTFTESTVATSHKKIKIFNGTSLPQLSMTCYIRTLRDVCASRDAARLILTLKEVLPDYNVSALILNRILNGNLTLPDTSVSSS
ncbi:MAG: polysaccharide biosynthesis protein [Acidobacteria bacterium]|nr:polysaccharide biosynthesis protein [Acidobacteriota bacterium]